MKKFEKLASYMMALCMICLPAACGSDDEGGGSVPGAPTSAPSGATDFEEERYADQAAKYNIQGGYETNGNTIESVELLADGNYIVTYAGYNYYTQPRKATAVKMNGRKDIARLLHRPAGRDTRSYGSSNLFHSYGNYTITSDGIVLDGLNLTMAIAEGERTIEFKDNTTGRISTVNVTKEAAADGVNSRKLCRTWLMEATEVWGSENGINLVHLRYNCIEKKVEAFDLHPYLANGEDNITIDDFLGNEEEMPVEVTFSPSGTYCVVYGNGYREYSSWEWADENRGLLFYDWNEDDDEEDSAGFLTTTFSGKRCYIVEDYTYEENEDGETYKTRMVNHTILLAK